MGQIFKPVTEQNNSLPTAAGGRRIKTSRETIIDPAILQPQYGQGFII